MTGRGYTLLGTLLIGFVLAGCDLGPTTNVAPSPSAGGTTAAPTGGSPAVTEVTAAPSETSAPTAIITGTAPLSPTSILQPGTIQSETITVNAAGALQPTRISATAGLTLEITLANRSEADALLVFDLAPSGAMAITLPGTLAITGTEEVHGASTATTSTIAAPGTTTEAVATPTATSATIATTTGTKTTTKKKH
jgi:hypothetical protein